MSLRGVIFDLDGTLIDSEPLWAKVETSVAASGGVPWTQEDAFSFFGRPLRETTQAIVDRGLDLTVDEAIDRMIDELAAIYRQSVPWMPGAYELLQSLGKEELPAALGTQSYGRLAHLVRDAAPAGVISAVVSGDELRKGKPDPEVFLTAAERLGLTPDDVVVVEDSPTGVAAGVAAGVPVLAVPPNDEIYRSVAGRPGVSFARSLADVTVGTLEALRAGEHLDLWRS
ncbi:HAD family phosphatase [Aeromicrobium camelliae]|uniref:HAD family phosphatase n=1 Tax=Aeromicrobium camelliae TaxID=1538144 RepID=A0A3N6X6M4_9ACTN|nr:HAD family phosphatase [Aeromicrobium camelliae]RQN09298.1 HAD family phosphatase [Aeromicrobium camelliae]